MFETSKKGFILKLKISPNSSKNEFIKSAQGLKIKLTAQPVENKANKMLIEFLSKSLKFPKSDIKIIKGETSKEKTVLFENLTPEKKSELKNIIDNL